MDKKLKPIHPAEFSKGLVGPLAKLLREFVVDGGRIVDPFAGLGQRLAQIGALAGVRVQGVEIERAYFELGLTHPCVIRGDSTELAAIFGQESFDGAISSPVYPNGVADSFWAKDDSVRHTYAHRIRQVLPLYQLHSNNTASLSPRHGGRALDRFYDIHARVWLEVHRVLRPGAPFIINVKDPLNEPFVAKTREQLEAVGFTFVRQEMVATPGLNHGSNRERKTPWEDILVMVK